ncbi:MAG TPA: hypothetical protein VLR69_19055, partial [Thermoanaerobaculia bacterium]|nr:hypothetical protein [Thermoanaerobaculia bacterium]
MVRRDQSGRLVPLGRFAAQVASGLLGRKIPRPRPPGAAAPRARHVMWRAWMAKEEGIEMEGVVTEVLPDRNYR